MTHIEDYFAPPRPRRRALPTTLDESGDVMVPVAKLAREFGCTQRTIRRWVYLGKLGPTALISGRRYARRRNIERLKNGEPVAPAGVSE